MTTYAYLRVSTNEQDLEKNKADILKFANDKELGQVNFIEEKISGTKKIKDRLIGDLLNKIQAGDALIVPELSRIARSMTSIFEVIKLAKETGFVLYSLKENFTTADESITSTITSTIFALVAEIERSLISQRTKEALAARKADGIILGRPTGKGKSSLDKSKNEILQMISLKVPKTTIAKSFGTSRQNLDKWLKYHA